MLSLRASVGDQSCCAKLFIHFSNLNNLTFFFFEQIGVAFYDTLMNLDQSNAHLNYMDTHM